LCGLETRGCSRAHKPIEAQWRKLGYQIRKTLMRMCARIACAGGCKSEFQNLAGVTRIG